MGDTGSQMLGFLAITLCLALTQPQKVLSPLFPLILLGFPVLDTLTVMTGRIMRGVSPFKADKNHFHHKLMRQGLYHSEAVFVIYAIQSLAVLLAYVLRFESDIAILIVYAAASFLLIAATTAAGRRHWKRPRLDLIDRVVKGRLKQWRDRQVAIKIVYRMVRYGLPLLLLTSCLIPTRLPDYFGLLVSAFATVVVLVCRYAPRYSGNTARAVLYLTIPLMVFEAQKAEAEFVDTAFVTLYHAGFGIIAAAVVLTLRLTRRQNGFKATPMDFIVLFVAVVLPNLPGTEMVSEDLGNLTAKIVILLFGYEVLIGECRNELRFVGLSTVAILAVAAIKALVM
jgi:UDP-GlcNAc:undecaprenyl-phosphate GlcNAc-1-phosphate transferase